MSSMIGIEEEISVGAGIHNASKMMTRISDSSVIVDEYSIVAALNLINAQDWESFQFIVLSNPAYFKALANAIANCSELNGMTMLHAVVRCDAPLSIVTKMLELCPEMTFAKDCLGRTPLHVAAGCRTSPALIKAVARVNPIVCSFQDECGNTPLHFACDSSCVLFTWPQLPQEQPNHDAVVALLSESESFHAATIEDDEEMTPVEYAILSGASIETVKLLQAAACKYLRSQSQKIKSSDQCEVVNLISNKRRRLALPQAA